MPSQEEVSQARSDYEALKPKTVEVADTTFTRIRDASVSWLVGDGMRALATEEHAVTEKLSDQQVSAIKAQLTIMSRSGIEEERAKFVAWTTALTKDAQHRDAHHRGYELDKAIPRLIEDAMPRIRQLVRDYGYLKEYSSRPGWPWRTSDMDQYTNLPIADSKSLSDAMDALAKAYDKYLKLDTAYRKDAASRRF